MFLGLFVRAAAGVLLAVVLFLVLGAVLYTYAGT